MADHRWNEQDRYRGFGGERSRYEELRDPDAYGRGEQGDEDRGAWDRPHGNMGAAGYGAQSHGEAARMGRHDQGSHGHASRAGTDTYGPHRGRGPRGYQRSDERIRDEINDRLTDDPMIDASDIEVSVDKGEVTLNGTVHRRDDKRRAEDIAEQVSGVSHVQNNLRATPLGGPRTGGSSPPAVGDSTSYPDGNVGVGNLARE